MITAAALCGEELPEAVRDHVDPINDHELAGVVDDHEAASIRRCWCPRGMCCVINEPSHSSCCAAVRAQADRER
jgi:hypothetical protein